MSDTNTKIDYSMAQEILGFFADRQDHRAMVATEEGEIIMFREREDDFRTAARIIKDYADANDLEFHICDQFDNLTGMEMVLAALEKALPWGNEQRRHPEELTRGQKTKLRISEMVEKMGNDRDAAPPI